MKLTNRQLRSKFRAARRRGKVSQEQPGEPYARRMRASIALGLALWALAIPTVALAPWRGATYPADEHQSLDSSDLTSSTHTAMSAAFETKPPADTPVVDSTVSSTTEGRPGHDEPEAGNGWRGTEPHASGGGGDTQRGSERWSANGNGTFGLFSGGMAWSGFGGSGASGGRGIGPQPQGSGSAGTPGTGWYSGGAGTPSGAAPGGERGTSPGGGSPQDSTQGSDPWQTTPGTNDTPPGVVDDDTLKPRDDELTDLLPPPAVLPEVPRKEGEEPNENGTLPASDPQPLPVSTVPVPATGLLMLIALPFALFFAGPSRRSRNR